MHRLVLPSIKCPLVHATFIPTPPDQLLLSPESESTFLLSIVTRCIDKLLLHPSNKFWMLAIQLAAGCYQLAIAVYQSIPQFHLFHRSWFSELKSVLGSAGQFDWSQLGSHLSHPCFWAFAGYQLGQPAGCQGWKEYWTVCLLSSGRLAWACSHGSERVPSGKVKMHEAFWNPYCRLAQNCFCCILFTKSSQEASLDARYMWPLDGSSYNVAMQLSKDAERGMIEGT